MGNLKRLYYKDINTIRFIAFVPIFVLLTALIIKTEGSSTSTEIIKIAELISQNSFDLFFFISSFLITSLSLREYKYKNSFRLDYFYLRKALRIIPLLIIIILFTFIFNDKIIDFLQLTPLNEQPIKYYLLGLPNYFTPTSNDRISLQMVIWMMYMYIQFYLVWGIMLKYLKAHIGVISILFILIGVTSRLFHLYNDTVYVFDTLCYGVPIGMATLLANYNRTTPNIQLYFKKLKKTQIKYFYLIGIVLSISLYPLFSHTVLASVIPIFTSAFCGFIIMEQTFSKNSIIKFRKLKLLTRLGKISYGLLIFTPIVSTILLITFESLDKNSNSLLFVLIFFGLTFILTWILSDLSYNTFEKLFNRIKRDFKKV